jgi:hypothetical protein
VAVLQAEIWTQGVAACPRAESGSAACLLVIPALPDDRHHRCPRGGRGNPSAGDHPLHVALALATALLSG